MRKVKYDRIKFYLCITNGRIFSAQDIPHIYPVWGHQVVGEKAVSSTPVDWRNDQVWNHEPSDLRKLGIFKVYNSLTPDLTTTMWADPIFNDTTNSWVATFITEFRDPFDFSIKRHIVTRVVKLSPAELARKEAYDLWKLTMILIQ